MRAVYKRMSQIFDEQIVYKLKCKFLIIFAVAALTALFHPPLASALPILDTQLASFAVLGATPSVTNTGATTLIGDVGVSPAASITGKIGITVNGTNAATIGNPSVHEADATAILAQAQLAIAMTNLGLLGPGTLLGSDLTGLILAPGVYTVSAGTTNLAGALTLDGGGNANAFWLFQMPSTLITSSGSVVNVTNTGAGAGVFWNVGSSATLGTTTSFEGNILASTSITLATGATIGCGRALAHTGTVTMDTNTIGGDCTPSFDLSGTGLVFDTGGNVVDTTTGTVVVGSPVPEPGTFLLLGFGLAGLVAFRNKFQKA